MKPIEECNCDKCKSACYYRPGWFLPGEAEKAAELLELSLKDFFNKYLAVDWLVDNPADNPVFILAPAIETSESGSEYPEDPRGKCIFLDSKGNCKIHQEKPHECAAYIHGETVSDLKLRHLEIGKSWNNSQEQITELLGREPKTRNFFLFDTLGLSDFM